MSIKRILHFIESEGVYGAERVILNLSQQMQKQGEFTPVVGCIVTAPDSPSDLFDAARAQGIEAVKIPIANSKLLWQLPAAGRQIRKLHIDLIHSHGYKPSVFGFIIRLLTGIPIMSTCHLWFEPAKAPLKTRAMIRLEKWFYHWYPKVIGVSEPIVAILRHAGLHQNQVMLVRNGVNIPAPPNPEHLAQLREALGIGAQEFVLLNSARLTRQKGQWNLLEATQKLLQAGIPCRTLIVGHGPMRDELQQQIEQLKIGHAVSLLGFREDVDQLLALCDVFVLPSLDEGMPMSLLEAAAAQKPIVTTLVGDIGKLITHQHTGWVIGVNDTQALYKAIETLYNQPALARELALHAHQRMIAEYSSEAMNHQYARIYREIG
ncbi:glycosyltransferase family 4 protein [Cellvibrio japonicus]|uniref:Glycosyl transferase, putative, gt4B n=1 Tax=Cellvibrio japonicus (strain Ueda107) TaxID=498211 RepID=B3PF96_CELJU|nr:glycosyltransferase family 4 protein [Cellvibrio japonicus]ACE83998.1 glycosyl transferase, putative, gt4B [Cellvibrio japonicus Ueda107]QEI13645.1 glycosyltransferase family 4 protein [Cellvibrio japonicus]QEI17218.1 glycosyltransferase family 4 protein [Cellvibrio japonicus]QEI20796.1 glycosyltransferase family 4 protein [Cellvibrio japonicus]